MNGKTKGKEGQALVEFVLVLPFLLLLILGLAEAGYAFYDYILMGAANREGVRLASRGRFETDDVIERIIASGGITEVDGETAFALRTHGAEPNFGLIVTQIVISPTGEVHINPAIVTGTVSLPGGGVRPITSDDTRINPADYADMHSDITDKVNDLRADADFERLQNDIVVIESFLSHEPLFGPFLDLLQFPNPMVLYFDSSMRVMSVSR
ncbi:MAG: pilus assembly protein [Anaerolineae bacterium]|nr:pilus assembly protein [Anaerolineae bacterium]